MIIFNAKELRKLIRTLLLTRSREEQYAMSDRCVGGVVFHDDSAFAAWEGYLIARIDLRDWPKLVVADDKDSTPVKIGYDSLASLNQWLRGADDEVNVCLPVGAVAAAYKKGKTEHTIAFDAITPDAGLLARAGRFFMIDPCVVSAFGAEFHATDGIWQKVGQICRSLKVPTYSSYRSIMTIEPRRSGDAQLLRVRQSCAEIIMALAK